MSVKIGGGSRLQATASMSLVDGTMKGNPKKITEKNKKKGRPVLHEWAGRITLLKEEVELALRDGDAFISMMQKAHALDAERQQQLIAAKKLDPRYDMMFFTYQGPIQMVLQEVNSVIARYQDNEQVVDIEVDFHKKKPITNEQDENYVAPVEERRPLMGGGWAMVTTKVEAYPDRIYGYVTVILDKAVAPPTTPVAV